MSRWDKIKKLKNSTTSEVDDSNLSRWDKIKNTQSTVSSDGSDLEKFISDYESLVNSISSDYSSLSYDSDHSEKRTEYEQKVSELNSMYTDLLTRYNLNRSDLTEEEKELKSYLTNVKYSALGANSTYGQAADYYTELYNADSEYRKYFENIDDKKAAQGWDKYLDDLAKAEEEKDNEKWWEKIGNWLGSGGAVDTSLPMGTTSQVIHSLREDDSYMRPNDDWSDEQRRAFGNLYIQSPEKAFAYAEETNKRNNRAKEDDAIKKIQETATSGFWSGFGNTAGAIATTSFALADFIQDLAMANAGREIAPDGTISPFEYSQAVTGGISSHLNEQYGVIDEDVWLFGGKGWGDVYGLGTSIAQSAVSGLTMGSAGTLISYFGQGAASGVDDALRRGATESQAVLYGVALGAFEGIAEKIGIDNLFKIGSSATFKELAKNVLRQAGAEGLEEGLTSLLSNIADNVIMQDKSNFNAMVQAYMSNGLSEEEAKNKAWWDSWGDIAFDTIGGFVSGGVHASGATAFQTGISNYNAKKTYGDGSALVDEALKYSSEGSDLKALAEKYSGKLEGGKSLSGRQINLLNEAIANNDIAMIKSAAEARLTELGEKGDVAKIANIIAKQATGEKLTLSEKNTLKNSTFGQRVSNEANPDNINSGEYSSAWAENIGTRRVNPETYNKPLYELAKQQAAAIEAAETDAVAKSVAENQKASETELKVSESGKTTYTDAQGNTSDVTVQKVVSTKGGIKVKLDNGETVSVKDLSFSSENEAQMYEMVARMEVTPETANVLLNAFKPNNAKQSLNYLSYVPLAYKYGQWNYEAGLKNLKLSNSEKSIAFKQGRKDAEALLKSNPKVKATQKNNATETDTTKTDNDGIIYEGDFTYDESTANEVQKASMEGIRTINKLSSLEVHIFKSVMKNGKRVFNLNGEEKLAPNGYFTDGNKIYIDFEAGKLGEGAMLYTMSHEITHYIRQWNAKGFKELGDFLIAEYGKNGVAVAKLIEDQKKKIEDRYNRDNKALPSDAKLDDMAYEELVADAMSDMFADPKAYEKLAKLKQKNRTLWQKLGEAINQFLEKLRTVLGVYKTEQSKLSVAREAKAVRGFSTEAYNKLQDLYIKAFVEADANYVASIGSRNLDAFAEAMNENGEPLFQYRAMEADEDTYRQMLQKWGKMSSTQIDNLFDTIDNAMELIKDNLEVLDYAWEADIDDRAFSPVKGNTDKLYKVSLDFSTLCRKRILQQTVQAQLQEVLNKPLTREEGIAIRDALIALQEEGRQIEVACALCYVESARMKSPEQIRRFIEDREKVIKDFFANKSGGNIKEKIKKAEADARARLGVGNASLKSLPQNVAQEIREAKKAAKESYKPTDEEQKLIDIARDMTTNEFTTPEGLENLARNYPRLFDAYASYIVNATHAKGIENDTWWRAGDSAKIGDVLIANMNKENGLRTQSWSDFQVIHILDYIASTIELATRTTKAQAYSKVPDYVELMGLTGVMINMSLIPTAKFNGSLEYDSVEGIDYKRSLELRDKYHATAGTICIGMDHVQIKLLLGDTTIDYVIPYHRSSMSKALRKLMHIPTWFDYELYQSESNLSRTDAEKQAKKYGVKLLDASDPNYQKGTTFSEWFDIKEAQQIAKMENANPSDKAKQKKYGVMYGGYMAMQNAANNYLKLCAERGISPKFSHEKADFTAEENYWKLLIDRKMVDNVTGDVIEQQTIKPIFNQGEVMRILNDELARYPKVKADQDYAIRTVTEKMLSGEVKGGMSAEAIAKVMKKPVDNVTKVNILESSEEMKLSARDADARRTAALETFGTTTNFKNAGFVLPHGQMLNLSQYGLPGVTHKRIEAVFDDDIHGAEAVAKFINDGNVRIIERSPGIELSTKVAPTISQFNTLGRFIDQCSSKGRLYVDFTDENGENIGSITYDGDIDTEDVFYDIEKYYKTGRLPEQRSSYYFSDRDDIVDVNGKEYDHVIELDYKTFNKVKRSGKAYIDFIRNNLINQKITVYNSDGGAEIIEFAKANERVKKDGSDNFRRVLGKLEQAKNELKKLVILNAVDTAEISKFAEHSTENSHQWLDTNGWDKRTSYVLSEDGVIYPVDLHIAKAKDGRNILYDVNVKIEEGISIDEIATSERSKKIARQAVKVPKSSNKGLYHKEGDLSSGEDENTPHSDRDSYAPTFYSHMGKVIDGIKLEKMGANGVVPYLKGKGVKDEEIKWSGIETFLEGKKSVTKAELQEFVAGSQLVIEEEMSGEDIDLRYDGSKRAYNLYDSNGKVIDTFTYNEFLDGYVAESDEEIYSNDIELREALRDAYGTVAAPRWADYKLDGGTNYRELVFKMANSTYSNRAMRGHWGQDAEGILVHARIQDFDVGGKKMLFIEELQSDWHNEGREKGYTTKEYEDAVAVYDKLADDYAKKRQAFNKYVRSGEFRSDPDEVGKKKFDWLRGKMETAEKRMQAAEKDIEALKKKGMGDVADAPFRNTYHEYVLKRLLRMAAEEGYDSIGWTIADTQSKRWSYDYEKAYQIEYDQDMPKFLRKYGKQWGATVGETTVNGTQVWSMDIPDSMKDSVLHEGQTLYSDRDPNAVSDRTLLANALDSVAQNDVEKNKLAQYKKKIALIESEQAKLNEIKAKANELRFTKGRTAEETRTMRNLEFEANQIANRINTYDKQLMSLESTAALKGVLEREKTMLRKRLAQKERESIKAVKQKAAQTQREIVTHYQESRKKAIESRNKTEMRHKIKKVVSDLNKLLLHPTKDQHVPIGLQGVVAEALDAINMDTMNAEERVAYYNDLIAKSSDPDEIAMLTQKRDFFDYRDSNFKERITALKNAYAEFKTSDDPLIRNAHNDAIEELIKNTADTVGKKSLKDMSYEQLDAVHNMYTAVLATVRNSNKLFKEGRQETVSENSESVKREVKEVGGHHERVLKIAKFLKKFGWNMLKPVYAMKVIGSNTFTKLFDNVRKAEDTWAVDVREAKQFYEDVSAKYGYKKWDFKKQYTFKDSTGADFSLSLEQIMSLYAYSKREQADEHLEFGGFIFDESIEVTEKKHGIPLKYEVNDADPHRLRKEDILPITATLTSEQISFIDEMQSYLSDVMGAKGNEVSLAMYDIKLYNEKNYFPLKTSRYFREFDPEQSATPKLKNAGFSKKTVPQAGNPIVLSNFMDVWANHVNDMSMYHAFVLPLEDFMRVYNYSSTAGGYDSVQQYLKNAYGSQANQYIEKLMDDLNGGARVDSAADVISKGISLFKKSAVFASASVVIQQPSAIARSLAYINPKYFVTSSLSAMNVAKHGKVWDEVKKYAPVAVIKEMGYFDTGVGRSTVEWIKGNQTLREKADDVLSKAPAVADELTWCYIWEAVKRETKATTNLKDGSEEFLKKCGQRFTEVIVNTQVYDSVLSRSGMMRSKDTGMKMATAFMAEPTTAANMVIDGFIQGKRGNKRFMAASVGAVSTSIILNSMLVALVYAARDDDEDETYAEKYIGSLTTELIDGFNPLTYIPFVKDMWSIAQGYDVERSDMSVISDLWKTIEGIFNEDKAGWEKVADVTGAVSSLFGIPVKNLIRDAKGMYNLIETVTSGTPTTGAGISDAVEDAVKNSIPLWDRLTESDTKSDKLYEAIMSGDQAHIDRVKSGFTSEDALKNAMRAGLREHDSRINEAAQARLDGDISKYTRIAKEIIAEGNFSQDIVVGAINAEMTAIKKGESSVTEETENKDEVTSIYKASDLNAAFDNGDTTLALEIISDLIKTKVANGMEEKNAKSSVKSSMTSYWKPLYKAAYQSGNSTEMARIRKILYSSGLYGKSSDVLETCKDWLKN